MKKRASESEREPLALRTVTDTRLKQRQRGNAHPLCTARYYTHTHTTAGREAEKKRRRRKERGGGAAVNRVCV